MQELSGLSCTMLFPTNNAFCHCVTIEEDGKALVCDKRDRAFTDMFCCDHHLTLCFLVFHKHTCLKKGEVGQKFVQTNLLSRLSHKVYRLPFSFVLLLKSTNDG